jgi:hypothetical protein
VQIEKNEPPSRQERQEKIKSWRLGVLGGQTKKLRW